MQGSEIVGSRLSTEELVALLATPQVMFRHKTSRSMTPFAALALGGTTRVLDLVRLVVTPPDADAPYVATGAHASATA